MAVQTQVQMAVLVALVAVDLVKILVLVVLETLQALPHPKVIMVARVALQTLAVAVAVAQTLLAHRHLVQRVQRVALVQHH
jgi:hypothetical protein